MSVSHVLYKSRYDYHRARLETDTRVVDSQGMFGGGMERIKIKGLYVGTTLIFLLCSRTFTSDLLYLR